MALNHPLVKKILPHYRAIVLNELPANFQIAKRIVADLDRTLSKKQMWEMHSGLMKKFYEAKAAIDKGKLKLVELEQPRFSLLDLKVKLAEEILKSCELCEHKCRVNRLAGEKGICMIGNKCKISSEFVHWGEESYYTGGYKGRGGSHTIFFWSCNMFCAFCQNFTISHRLEPGIPLTPEALAKIIEDGKRRGCINTNFVGGEPTMHLPWILKSLKSCKVNTAIIWNSNMYMSEKAMKLLEGVVDVYLTDFKFGPECAKLFTKVKNYWEIVTRNHLIAAKQELTIRHLILPDHIDCCSFPILEWIAKNIKKCIVNPMSQYYPCFRAKEYPGLNRRITREEYEAVIKKAKELKINVLD